MAHKIVIGLIGFLLGGMSGGFLMGCICGKEYRKRINDLQDRNDILKQELKEMKSGNHERRTAKAVQEEKVLDKKIKEYGYSANDGEFDSDEEVDFNDPFEKDDDDKEENDKEIRLIGKGSFDEDLEYRDCERLTFYQEDGILADEYDEPISNQTDIIGIEAIEKAENTEEDFLYVSNDILDRLYEITIEHSDSYYRDLMQ